MIEQSFAIPQVELFDVPIHSVTFEEAVDILIQLARRDTPSYAVTANVDHIVRFSRFPEVRRLYTQADLVVADGVPLVWASKILGRPLPERVAGSDLFPALCAVAAESNLSVFLLGGARGVADRAARILMRRHRTLRVVGTHCPPVGFEHDPTQSVRTLDAVRSAQPDILFVGLGSPKQEQWILANKAACGARLSIGVGISFSFVCGDVRRAPQWMQRAGLEWLHRLSREPRRLWRRYLVDDSNFLLLLARHLIRPRRTRDDSRPKVI